MKGWREQFFYTSVGVGMAMATSAFTMIAGLFAVASTGWILAGVTLAGLFCMAVSMSIGELASMFPSAPGLRTYFKVAFGDTPSLVLLYLYLIFAILIAGLESFVFSQVVDFVFPGFPAVITVTGLLSLVVCVNLVGFHLPRGLQIATSIASVSLILFSAVLGIARAKIGPAEMFGGTGSSDRFLMLPAVAGMGIFLFTGFEWVTPLGLRPKSYERKIPISMPVAVLVLIVTYCSFVLGAASQLTAKTIQATVVPQINYFQALYGPWGPYLGLVLSLLAIFSTFNAGILGGSQLIYLLGREGNLPPWTASLSLRTGCPVGAILLLGGLASLSSLFVLRFRLEIEAALVGASIMCVIYSGFIVSVMRLRTLRPTALRPFRARTPTWLQICIASVLILIGCQTLFSEHGKELGACTGMALAIVFAWGLAYRSRMRRAPVINNAKVTAATDQLF